MSSSDYFYQQHFKGLHSHNDQEQTNNLTDALGLGFTSIEVDTHLVSGEIRVTHTAPGTLGVTLQTEYLSPIAALPVNQHPTHLVVDLKTDPSDDLFTAVVAAVASFSTFDDGHMTIVCTGVPPVSPTAHPSHVQFGRPRTLANLSDSEVAVIEVDFSDFSSWDGTSPAPLEVREGLLIRANDAHRVGKQLRIYFMPSTTLSWQIQYDMGCDWIQPGGTHPPGADDITSLAAWLSSIT